MESFSSLLREMPQSGRGVSGYGGVSPRHFPAATQLYKGCILDGDRERS